MKNLLVTIFSLFFFATFSFKAAEATAKTRDVVMPAAGAISVSLIIALSYSAIFGEDKPKKKVVKKADPAKKQSDPFSDKEPLIDPLSKKPLAE